jgi:hypothetical protein
MSASGTQRSSMLVERQIREVKQDFLAFSRCCLPRLMTSAACTLSRSAIKLPRTPIGLRGIIAVCHGRPRVLSEWPRDCRNISNDLKKAFRGAQSTYTSFGTTFICLNRRCSLEAAQALTTFLLQSTFVQDLQGTTDTCITISTLKQLLVDKLGERDAKRFSDVHLQNLLAKGIC